MRECHILPPLPPTVREALQYPDGNTQEFTTGVEAIAAKETRTVIPTGRELPDGREQALPVYFTDAMNPDPAKRDTIVVHMGGIGCEVGGKPNQVVDDKPVINSVNSVAPAVIAMETGCSVVRVGLPGLESMPNRIGYPENSAPDLTQEQKADLNKGDFSSSVNAVFTTLSTYLEQSHPDVKKVVLDVASMGGPVASALVKEFMKDGRRLELAGLVFVDTPAVKERSLGGAALSFAKAALLFGPYLDLNPAVYQAARKEQRPTDNNLLAPGVFGNSWYMGGATTGNQVWTDLTDPNVIEFLKGSGANVLFAPGSKSEFNTLPPTETLMRYLEERGVNAGIQVVRLGKHALTACTRVHSDATKQVLGA